MVNAHSPSRPKIKIFLDGADRQTMVELATRPTVHGFTTNPSLMKKSGVKDYRAFCQGILPELQGKPVSFEVFADDLPGMQRQAEEIATWGESVYVKIPVVNTRGESTARVVRTLSHHQIKLNVTAIYTVNQVWEVTQALKGGAPSIISVFAGRMADTGKDPLPVMYAAAELCRNADPSIELLWASTREAFNAVQAEQTGCQIITAPLDVIRKLDGFGKDMQELTLETVRAFKADAETAGFSL